MPDFQDFSITRSTSKSMTVPTWKIEVQLTDSTSGASVRDLRGAKAVNFPQVLALLPDADQDEFVRYCVQWLITRYHQKVAV